jgi:D-alanyl-D-alanine carboxypeptidase
MPLVKRLRSVCACLLLTGAISACNTISSSPTPTAAPSTAPSSNPSAEPTPDAVAPAIATQDPPQDGVLTAQGVRVTFTEPVQGVDRTAFQLLLEDARISSTVTLDSSGRVATLVPDVALPIALSYTVTLSGRVHDLAGNRLPLTTWTVVTSDVVTFASGTYTGWQFGATQAELRGLKRATLSTSSMATASEYRVIGDDGYLLVAAGIWEDYWIHGSPDGVAQDDLTAPIAPLPACDYIDLPAARVGYGQWGTTVLDTVFRLPSGYAPGDLVDTSQAGLNGSYFVRGVALQDLSAMVSAARADGAKLAVQSAYRSYRGQVLTFDGWVSQVGYAEALQTSARPGHSEHQLGTAIDFRTAGGVSPWLYADWATTTEGTWLAANAWEFGWAMSYPRGTSAVSCYSYEPWHYRYLGRTATAALHDAGITPREWLWEQGYGVR